MPGKALDRSAAVRSVLRGLLVANVAVVIAKAAVGTVAGSLAVLGDAIHSSVDAVYNVLGLIVVRVAYQILLRAVPVLVDERAIPEPTIRQSAQAVAGVKSAYGIRSRGGAGTGVRYAEVTIAVDPAANVADAHAIADAVEERLKKDLALQEVTVHVEPC